MEEYTLEQYERFRKFLTKLKWFTEEEIQAMENDIPMTRELYNSIVDRCVILGCEAEDILADMVPEYPDFSKS